MERSPDPLRIVLLTVAIGLLSPLGNVPRAQAQSVEITMRADRQELAVDETLSLEIRVDIEGARPDEIQRPDLSAFDVVAQRRSQPMQFSFGFGGRQQRFRSSIVEELTLRPRREGTIAIEPAVAKVDGRRYRSNPLTIRVSARGSASQPAVPIPNATSDPGSLAGDPEAFLRAEADKIEAYVGEQITVALHLYSRAPLGASPTLRRDLSTDGFWAHDLLPDTRTLQPERQLLEGQRYYVYLLRKIAVFPMRAGDLTIGGAEIVAVTGSPFDFFQRPNELLRASNSITIHARELPRAAAPLTVVGQFTLGAQLDRQQAKTGEALTLSVVLEGEGNLREARIELPQVPGLRALKPEVEDQLESRDDRVGGRRTFRWIIIVEEPGLHEIPPFGLDAFDPRTKTTTRLRTESFAIEASGAPLASSTDETPTTGKGEAAETLGPLRPRSQLRRSSEPLAVHPGFVVALALPPLTWLVILAVAAFRRRQSNGSGSASRRERAHAARKQLAEAREQAASGDARALYATLTQVLTRAIEARLDESVASFTHEALARRLVARGMDEELARTLLEALDGYDFARFSTAGSASGEIRAAVDCAAELLEKLEGFSPLEGGIDA